MARNLRYRRHDNRVGNSAFLELTGSSEQGIKVASMGWFCLLGFPILVMLFFILCPITNQAVNRASSGVKRLG